ncbi:MAG: PKD domain-containing protein, partial [Flavobacteriales bacterium]
DVTLTVTTSTGCTATLIKQEFIRVGVKPTADFTATPFSICFKDTVNFQDLSPDPPTVTAWLWDFGDGNGSQSQNPVHIYDRDTSGTADPFDITLIVFNNGCPDTLVKSDFITVLGPKPLFNPLYDCSNPLTVRFDNGSDTVGMTYQWNFGDGDTSTLQDPVHTFATRGDYFVTLLDSNLNTGCAAAITGTVQVRVIDAIATASPDSGCAPLTVNVFGSGSQDYSFLRWNFGDPPSSPLNTSPYADTLHLFNRPGAYQITLTATDIHSCSQTETIPIAVLG